MKRILLFFVFILFSVAGYSQDFSSLWEGHFSYLNITDLTSSEDKLFVASDNAVFSLDYNTNEIEKISTVEGLSGETISNIYYSVNYDLLIIGYETGLMDIVLDDEVLTVIDIINKVTIPPNKKRINHFYESNGLIYISTDYGVSVYDMERLEFGDTYFIGFGGSQIQVNQIVILDGSIYTACGDGNGIKKAELSNPNLIDFTQWVNIRGGNYISIESVDSNLFAVSFARRIYSVINDEFTELFFYNDLPIDTRASQSKLVVTTANNVFVYDSDFNLQTSVIDNQDLDANFTSATINSQDQIFIGTSGIVNQGKPGLGVLKSSFNDPLLFEEIHPDGPLKNNVFSIETPPNEIWATFGGYSRTFNPNGGLRRSGISHFKEGQWRNIKYDTLTLSIDQPDFLSDIAVNPFNTNQVYIMSHWSGVIEVNDEVATTLYDQNNSTIIPFNGNGTLHYSSVSIFDNNGALWVMNGRVGSPLNKFENDQWTSYDFTPIIPVPPTNSNLGFSSLVIDNSGTKFTGTFSFGLVGFNERGATNDISFSSGEANNMPSPYVMSLAIDNNGQLWIGTENGLRILFNTSNFFEDGSVNNIVILEDGIPKELLSNQAVVAIEVDGSNNKWIGTVDSGVFYFSPDGQETIYHFTKDNSPLPTNTINDISIDPEDGTVYIATTKGLLSFASGGTKASETLDDAFVYPNPVRPEYNILGSNDLNNINNGVKISGLTENVNIKITDIEGNLVTEAQSRVNQRSSKANYNFAIDGGTAIWNGKNLGNNVVATGVYLILISDLDSLETKVLKLLIVR